MGALKDKFIERKNYDEFGPSWKGFKPNSDTSPTFSYLDPKLPSLYTEYFIDSWNVIPFYGKVDTLGIPIIPRMGLVTFCSYSKDPIKVSLVQPAITFYNSFREQYKDYYALNTINKNSTFFKKDLFPVKGHIDGDIEYFNKIKELYVNFSEYQKPTNSSLFSKLWGTNVSNKIKNFNDFFNELENFISFKNLYFTRAGYVESIDYSLLHTGLSIEIYDGNSSDDSLRQSFINDVNFPSFVELCTRNNLKIDREIPWRVYIDVRTTPSVFKNTNFEILDFETNIKKTIPSYKNIQDFFDFYYARVVPYDDVSFVYFQEFINIINSFYKSYVRSFPTFNFYSVNECGKAEVEKISRAGLPTISVEQYLDLYLRLRNVELRFVINKEYLQALKNQSLEIYKAIEKDVGFKDAVINAVKHYVNNLGTLAYRNPSLYELDEKQKMP